MKTYERRRARVQSVLVLGIWLPVAAIAGNVACLTLFAQQPAPTPSTPSSQKGSPVAARTPYTVALQEKTRTSSGSESPQGTLSLALRSDGAYAERYEYFGSFAVIQRTIELPSGVTVVVDDVRERKTSSVRRLGTSLRARMDPSRGCTKNDLGEAVFPGQIIAQAVVNGYQTVAVSFGETISWFATGLGCAKVQERTKFDHGGVNEKVVVTITPGEPDDAFFHVPARYEEVPPSVFFQMDPASDAAGRADQSYFQRRPPR